MIELVDRLRKLPAYTTLSIGILLCACASSERSAGPTNGTRILSDGGQDDGAPDASADPQADARSGAEPPDAQPGSEAGPPDPEPPPPPGGFDWVGILGTGQSLSDGDHGVPVVNNAQPYHNLKLLDTGPDPKYPIDGGGILSLVPLVELIRPRLAGYEDAGGEYPDNIRGETPHSGMANQISALSLAQAKRDYVTVHSEVGWGGKCIGRINKAGGWRAYPGSLAEARAFARMAKAAGKSFGYGAIVLTHGECDSTNQNYAAEVRQLWADYNADLKAITGQNTDIPLLISQQSTRPLGPAPGTSASALAAWRLGVDHPAQIVCTGPKYQYAYASDLIHLDAPGYVRLGQKYGQVYYQMAVLGMPWKPLQPVSVKRSGAKIVVTFEVPVPPLNWDATLPSPHQTVNSQWAQGKGFEALDSTGPLTIQSVTIVGSTVEITLAATPTGTNLVVRYAMTQDGAANAGGTADGHMGLLRDSDGFVGYDAEVIRCNVTQGSTSVTSVAPNGFSRRAGRDDVAGASLPSDTIVASKLSDGQITLSRPWSGPSGTADLSMHHDHHNYAVHFEMPVP